MTPWLHVRQGRAPLVVSIPHAGTTIPAEIAEHLVSHDLAIHDADWFIPQLYAFAEIARRRISYFAPYHDALEGEIDRLRLIHPRIVVYDAHSIRSCVERLFDGELPALNLGTNSGASAGAEAVAVAETHMAASSFTHVTNGRFKGGWITRHYGRPEQGVHALQMEIAQRAYMDEPDGLTIPTWNPERAAALQAVLEPMLTDLIDWAASKDSGQ
jgi:N-formylglutamate deformylase